MTRLTWVQPEDLLLHAFVQAHHDDIDVTDLETEWLAHTGTLQAPTSGAGAHPASSQLRARATHMLDTIDHRTGPLTTPILDQTSTPATPEPTLPTTADADRIHGAWLGRAIGCLLGKPVEKIPREGIRAILDSTGDWPLTQYFTARGLDPAIADRYPWNRRSRPTSLRENIDGMPEDDDLNYPLINLAVLEQHRDEFTTDDVADAWLANMPAGRAFTAERVTYRNLLLGHDPLVAAERHNPFREWIGAWIRGDVFGWSHPGRPRVAAGLALRDARLSHRGAGLEGELWVAAACAVAPVAEDMDTVFDAAAGVVSSDGALLAAINAGREIGADPDVDRGLDALHARFGQYHWVHVLNNAATVAWALSAASSGGATGFEDAICRAVMAGWDTDSVGATVGSIAGAMVGAQALPDRWTAPLQDRYSTSLPGFAAITFTELTQRTLDLTRRNHA